MSNPWYRQLPPKIRDRHATNQTELDQLLDEQIDGDWITIHEGDYPEWRPFSSDRETVIQGEGHAKVNIEFELYLPDAYILNLHLPGRQLMDGDYCGFINNVIEGDGQTGYAGLLSTGGKGQLTYQNIICNCEHGLYIQNKNTDGIEYVVQNYIGDCVSDSNSRAIHAYTQQPDNLYSLYFIQNIVNGNEFLIGDNGGTIPKYNLLQDNWIQRAAFRAIYSRECTDLINNKFYNGFIQRYHFLGNDYQTDDFSTTTGNTIYENGSFEVDHIQFGIENDAMLRGLDNWDYNSYFGKDYFRAKGFRGGAYPYFRSLQEWRDWTRSLGKEFDTNSTFTQGAPGNQYWLLPNDYDPNRALLVVWGQATVSIPGEFTFSEVTNPYKEIESQYLQAFCIPNELKTFVIRYKATEHTCDLDSARVLLKDARAKSNQKGVRNRITAALKLMEPCQ